MKLTKSDLIAAIASGLVCYALLFGFPVWALFFGWSWYGVARGGAQAFKKILPAMALGYLAGGISSVVYNYFDMNIHVMVLMVGLTVLVMKILFHQPSFSEVTAAFGAYSCLFAGYFSGQFPLSEMVSFGDVVNVLRAIAWLALANICGLIVGYLIDYFMLKNKKK